MPALTHSPAQVTAQVLVDLGLAYDRAATPPPARPVDWTVYADKRPPQQPDRCLWTATAAGQDDGRHQATGELFQHYGVQVGVRGRTAAEAWRKADAVRTALAERATGVAVTVTDADGSGPADYLVASFNRIGQPLRMGVEPGSDRFLYAVNALLSVAPADAAGTGTGTGTNEEPDPAHTVLTYADDGSGNLLVTTAAAHGLTGGVGSVTFSGSSGGVYDGGLFPVDETPTPTTFLSYGAYAADAAGGTWSQS